MKVDVTKRDLDSIQTLFTECLFFHRSADEAGMGFQSGERERLEQAWEMYAMFKYNARRQRHFSDFVQFSFIIAKFNLFVTVSAVLSTSASSYNRVCPDVTCTVVNGNGTCNLTVSSSSDAASLISGFYSPDMVGKMTIVAAVLPLVAGLFLTVMTEFSPVQKWAALENTGAKIVSEIYRYRARAQEYSAAKAFSSSRWEDVLAVKSENPLASYQRVNQSDATSGKEDPARVAFRKNVHQIASVLVGADLKNAGLQDPPSMEQAVSALCLDEHLEDLTPFI